MQGPLLVLAFGRFHVGTCHKEKPRYLKAISHARIMKCSEACIASFIKLHSFPL
jgi:hypothetical protein